MRYLTQSREKFEHNTDPRRRCYNGCHFSSEWRWSEWSTLGGAATEQEAEDSVARWKSIGRKTCEFRWVKEAA